MEKGKQKLFSKRILRNGIFGLVLHNSTPTFSHYFLNSKALRWGIVLLSWDLACYHVSPLSMKFRDLSAISHYNIIMSLSSLENQTISINLQWRTVNFTREIMKMENNYFENFFFCFHLKTQQKKMFWQRPREERETFWDLLMNFKCWSFVSLQKAFDVLPQKNQNIRKGLKSS